MGWWARVRARFTRGGDTTPPPVAPDPRQVLDASYTELLTLLQTARRGLADLVTTRVRLEQQAGELRSRIAARHADAERAVAAGDDATARDALVHAAAIAPQVTELDAQRAHLAEQEAALSAAVATLSARAEQFRTRSETAKAQYAAADAQAKVTGALSGLTGGLGAADAALDAVEDLALTRRAQADAYTELTASGDLPGAPGGTPQLPPAVDVDAQLAALKGRVLPAPDPDVP